MADSDDRSEYREVDPSSPNTHHGSILGSIVQQVIHASDLLRAEIRIGDKRKKNNEMVGGPIQKKKKEDETTIDLKREIAWKLCTYGYTQKSTAKNRWKGFYTFYNEANPNNMLEDRKAEY
jgi:hypothetical protein